MVSVEYFGNGEARICSEHMKELIMAIFLANKKIHKFVILFS